MTTDPIQRAVHAVRLTQLLAEVDPADLHTETVWELIFPTVPRSQKHRGPQQSVEGSATRCTTENKRRKADQQPTEETT